MDLAQGFTSLPIQEFWFVLPKGAFRDALSRTSLYSTVRNPSGAPSFCACGKKILSWSRSVMPYGWLHYHQAQLWNKRLKSATVYIYREPELQPVNGEELIGKHPRRCQTRHCVQGFWGGALLTHLSGCMCKCLIPTQDRTNTPTATKNMNLRRITCQRYWTRLIHSMH